MKTSQNPQTHTTVFPAEEAGLPIVAKAVLAFYVVTLVICTSLIAGSVMIYQGG